MPIPSIPRIPTVSTGKAGAGATEPANTVLPAISGTVEVGQTLTCSTGTWTGTPTPTYTYQWQRAGVNIGGATASTFALTYVDYGSAIRCVVTATNTEGAVAANSTSTAAVTYNAAVFVTTWTTTTTPHSVTLPLVVAGSYNFTVSWGDGTADSTVTAYNDADITHSYATPGTYVMAITGTCDRWDFFTVSTSAALLKTIDQWGTGLGWTIMTQAFRGCTGLTTVAGGSGTSGVTGWGTGSANGAFRGCTSLTSVGTFSLASSTSFIGVFRDCTALVTGPTLNPVTGLLTGLFQGCTALVSVPRFDATAATSFSSLFNGCTSLTTVSINVNPVLSTMTSTFTSTGAITSCILDGITATFTIASNQLQAAALDALYTSLGGPVATTITVTGNPGTTGDDPTIATAKGWTVTS